MPSENVIKRYLPDSIYHIYNRGLDRQKIFRDENDCQDFLSILSFYLSKPVSIFNTRPNFFNKISILSYCLMPNHYHFLLHQTGEREMPKFMRSVMTTYSLRMNKKYDRVGYLYQGPYKARLIIGYIDILHVSAYIHMNPDMDCIDNAIKYRYSSLQSYVYRSRNPLVSKAFILGLLKGRRYEEFLKGQTFSHLIFPSEAFGVI